MNRGCIFRDGCFMVDDNLMCLADSNTFSPTWKLSSRRDLFAFFSWLALAIANVSVALLVRFCIIIMNSSIKWMLLVVGLNKLAGVGTSRPWFIMNGDNWVEAFGAEL